ncbi:transglycosylase domain-containing protein [Streptomyces sp. H10-C2]|uniref:transglycosylase domain-containing protein n=1 Tax=unclassified Streptomyces TaxID=2593676 RepID=UPI0024BA280F|nr:MULTISPECIES: transglycosylase domain-containing protein [unclassified Streptomyces]MDJ0344407.1 transglycosylase domain-containing protein [Streptomyces sp. PH10-H1]MDJ0373776.1 transglycosylase domain-containing protein [Streptomyces sp. H10-C2]
MSDEPKQQEGSTASSGWAPRPPATDRRGRPKRTGLGRLIPTWRMVTSTVIVVLLICIGGFFLGYALVPIPNPNAAATAQSNVYFYADGKTEIARDGEINRENVTLAQIARTAQYAALSAEDRGFYHESAVSPKAMIRAAWNTVTGKGAQSGSTITQQYVKNYYLNQEQTALRKVKEFFIAIKLDRNETKEQILEGYLNTSYFGRNSYGIQAASRAYFSKDADKLTTAEGAYLATLLNAPSEYDVVTHPANAPRAEARWNYVLDGMVKEGWLSAQERAITKFPTPGKPKPAASKTGQRGYLIEAVNDYLASNNIIDAETLRAGGYRIVTTIQKDKEDAFVTAAKKQIYDKLGTSKADTYVRAGGASIDPATGKVVAMYGGIDYTKQYVNNATRRDYQVGSTFKPFIFASAVQNNSQTQDGRTITPRTLYNGANLRPVTGPDGPVGYNPPNEDGATYGDITVTRAMDRSVNAVYAQLAQDVGVSKVNDTVRALGVPDAVKLIATPSMALGTMEASPLDMAQAYATLANHGKHIPYTFVEKITKDHGDLALPKRDGTQAVTRQAADTTTSVLQSVVDGGTAVVAQDSGWPSAAKTGTIDEDKAAWFAGYTPNLATVVAVMGQDPDTGGLKSLNGAMNLPRINGGGPPGDLWAAYTAAALSNAQQQSFDLQLQDGAATPSETPSETPSTSPTPSRTPSQTPSRTPSQTPSGTPSQTPSQTPSTPTETPSGPPSTPPTLLPSGGQTGGGAGGPAGG